MDAGMRMPGAWHRWNVTAARAVALQRELAGQIVQEPLGAPARWIAGVDCAFSSDSRFCLAAAVVWDRIARERVETRLAYRRLTFAYVPGLLSFREAPAILAALRRLDHEPDVILCDGQGLAHPRRFGLACHVGLWTDRPTIGCAKSLLIGEHADPSRDRGSRSPLRHKGETVGTVLRTQAGVRPVYVSVGHRIDLASAEQCVLDCAVKYRLPEPTRLADLEVAAAKRSWPEEHRRRGGGGPAAPQPA